MTNVLDRLPLDKSRHAIGGMIISAVVAVVAVRGHVAPAGAAISAIVITGLIGGLNEALDAALNYLVTGDWRGVPVGRPHSVEFWDAVAITIGGLVAALPLLVFGLGR